ncbi:porin [Photobacterium nomapromontoriensis]|uniref:porin n=1 Tax=Photobacterium nomapromontoriensis TaxID=2910237 RepID=UPI003D0B48DA
MNKTLFTAVFIALSTIPTASAIEIYKDSKNDASIGGYAGVRLLTTDNTTEVVNGSSRINFNFQHTLTDGWSAYSTFEWGVSPFGDTTLVFNNQSEFEAKNDDLFNSRLAYIGLSHAQYGSITFGKQWGAWYDVVVDTDNAYVWGGEASGVYTFGSNGAINGVGMADKSILYRNSFGQFSFALQTQLQQNDIEIAANDQPGAVQGTLNYDDSYGVSFTYAFTNMYKMFIGGNIGEFKGSSLDNSRTSETDFIYGIGATWGDLSKQGWFASANLNINEWHQTDNNGFIIPEAEGGEIFVAYNFKNGFRPYAAYNYLNATKDYEFSGIDSDGNSAVFRTTEYKDQSILVGLLYQWDSVILMYLEAQFDMSDYKSTLPGSATSGDNSAALGIRYTF